MNKQELIAKIDELKAQLEPLEAKLNKIWAKEADDCEAKIIRCHKLKDKFDPTELRYSRTSRCACGAGLAYVKNAGMHSAWYCSAILIGNADREKEHDKGFPFSMYEIKSENETQTTRP